MLKKKINFILILFLCISIFYLLTYIYYLSFEDFYVKQIYDDTYVKFDNNESNNDDNLNCYIFGCSNNYNTIYSTLDLIGSNDSYDHIFISSDNNYYSLNNNILYKIKIDSNFDKINKLDSKITLPVILENDKIILKINLKYKDYVFIGYLTNNYYYINYIVYYKRFNDNLYFDELYEYVIIKIVNNEYEMKYKLLPRTKINNNENIWILFGTINLGPYKFIHNLN